MCLYPRLIRNRKYTETKKNGGIVPAISDIRTMAVPVGCGECMECRKKKAREWQVRLQEDIKEHKNGKFVTLTFSNEEITKLYNDSRVKDYKGYEKDNKVAKLAMRLFLERWRKKNKKSIRHWMVTELGHEGTENIHLHGIMYTDDVEGLKERWGYGWVWVGNYVSARTINYIVKYITKIDKDHKYYKSKILSSAGIGARYAKTEHIKYNKYKEDGTDEAYKTTSGHKMSMPIYWRNKIYTDEEKEKLWVEKLDKNRRWVDGKKIDISKGDEEYKRELKKAQAKSKRLGYGNGVKDWNEKQYEEQRRTMLQQERAKGSDVSLCSTEIKVGVSVNDGYAD